MKKTIFSLIVALFVFQNVFAGKGDEDWTIIGVDEEKLNLILDWNDDDKEEIKRIADEVYAIDSQNEFVEDEKIVKTKALLNNANVINAINNASSSDDVNVRKAVEAALAERGLGIDKTEDLQNVTINTYNVVKYGVKYGFYAMVMGGSALAAYFYLPPAIFWGVYTSLFNIQTTLLGSASWIEILFIKNAAFAAANGVANSQITAWVVSTCGALSGAKLANAGEYVGGKIYNGVCGSVNLVCNLGQSCSDLLRGKKTEEATQPEAK